MPGEPVCTNDDEDDVDDEDDPDDDTALSLLEELLKPGVDGFDDADVDAVTPRRSIIMAAICWESFASALEVPLPLTLTLLLLLLLLLLLGATLGAYVAGVGVVVGGGGFGMLGEPGPNKEVAPVPRDAEIVDAGVDGEK